MEQKDAIKVIEMPCTNILKLREYFFKHGKVKSQTLEVRWTPKKVKQILTEDNIKQCKGCSEDTLCWVSELLRKSKA